MQDEYPYVQLSVTKGANITKAKYNTTLFLITIKIHTCIYIPIDAKLVPTSKYKLIKYICLKIYILVQNST